MAFARGYESDIYRGVSAINLIFGVASTEINILYSAALAFIPHFCAFLVIDALTYSKAQDRQELIDKRERMCQATARASAAIALGVCAVNGNTILGVAAVVQTALAESFVKMNKCCTETRSKS